MLFLFLSPTGRDVPLPDEVHDQEKLKPDVLLASASLAANTKDLLIIVFRAANVKM